MIIQLNKFLAKLILIGVSLMVLSFLLTVYLSPKIEEKHWLSEYLNIHLFTPVSAIPACGCNDCESGCNCASPCQYNVAGCGDEMKCCTSDGVYSCGATTTTTTSTSTTTTIDSTPPTYSLNSTNSTLAGTPVKHSLNWTDNVGLSGYIFSFWNGTDLINKTPYSVIANSGESDPYFANKTIDDNLGTDWEANIGSHWIVYDLGVETLVTGVRVYSDKYSGGWAPCNVTVYVSNDTSNWGSSLGECALPDTTGWHWCDNIDKAGRYINLTVKTTDINGLNCGSNTLGMFYEFDFNSTGMYNDTWVAMTGLTNWSNVTKTVNSTVGATIRWQVYANDTSNNWNVSDIYSYITTGPLLEVNLITPTPNVVTKVFQNSTFQVIANITCKNGPCGTVYGTVRYNASSLNPDTAISTTSGSSPFYITSNQNRPVSYSIGGGCQFAYFPTGDASIGYDDGYNDTNSKVDIAGTSSTCTGRVNYTYSLYPSSATLFVTQLSDIGDPLGDGAYVGIQIYNFTSNNWYNWLNCSSLGTYAIPLNTSSGLIKSDGTVIVSGFVNDTVNVNTPILSFYDTYVSHTGGLSCGSLNKDQSCQLNWTVNATGTSVYKIGVLFNSSYTSVTQNHTNNATINILTICTQSVTLGWTVLDFGTYNPNTTNNKALGNDNKTYNITNTGTCTEKIWINATDIQNTTLGYTIGVGNLTWTNVTNSTATAVPMTQSAAIVNSSLSPNINVTTYYWLTIPPVLAGWYNGTLRICYNDTDHPDAC